MSLTVVDRDESTPVLALRPREAAKALGVSARTLWAMTRDGKVRCARIGRAVVYSVNDLQRWLEEQVAYMAKK